MDTPREPSASLQLLVASIASGKPPNSGPILVFYLGSAYVGRARADATRRQDENKDEHEAHQEHLVPPDPHGLPCHVPHHPLLPLLRVKCLGGSRSCRHLFLLSVWPVVYCLDDALARPLPTHSRSEEHTSELQSRQYLVCR